MSNQNDELGVALVRARKTYRADLQPQVAERLIGRISHRYAIGQSFRDSLNAVVNPTEFPDRRKLLGYRQVMKKVFGRRGGIANAAKRAA